MQFFGEFGKMNRKLWTGDYGRGFNAGLQKVLADGVKLRSSVGIDLSAVNTVQIKTDKAGQGKLGFNVASDRDGSRPSVFARWMVPISDANSIGMRVHKPYWKTDNSMPFLGWDWKYQNRNLALTTSIGGNVSDRMDSNDRNNGRNFEVSHSVTTGHGPLSVGGEVKYARAGRSRYAAANDSNGDNKSDQKYSYSYGLEFTDYNLGVDYNRENYGLGVRTMDKMRHVTGTMWSNVDRGVRVAALQSYDTQEDKAKTGVAVQLGDDTVRVKSKVDTSGDVGLSVVARLCDAPEKSNQPGAKVHANIVYNFKADQCKQAGLGFSIGDI